MPSIYTWPCCHYLNDKRIWLYGQLKLFVSGLLFIEDTKNVSSEEPKKLHVSFLHIVEIKKARSTLLYGCIVVKVNEENLWFSSFQQRENVFNILEHFWKEQLFSEETTDKNQELLQIVYDTQNTLMDAAQTLHAQGQQISRTSHNMNMMHNDITVAERITSDIDSWFGAWRLKLPMKKTNALPERIESPISTDSIEYPVLISEKSNENHTKGYIVLRKETLEILGSKSEILFNFVIKQISEINVHSPWDVSFVRHCIGSYDTVVHITSKKTPMILKTLEKVYKCEFYYDDPPIEPDSDLDEMIINESSIASKEIDTNKAVLLQTGQQQDFSSTRDRQKPVSDEDARELSAVLNNMKTLAENISIEQDAQIKQIDDLTVSVDKANTRIKATDWKVKKLT